MVTEAKFQELVAEWLAEDFADVESEVYLDSGRRPDFVAYTAFESYVIEVEDNFDSLYQGIGQVMTYAAETGYIPVLVFPADSVDQEDFVTVREYSDQVRLETV